MANYTNEQIMEMYRKLPKDVQEAIISVDTSEIIKEIGEKHKLMIDKAGELADETGLVMLGITHPSQYISNLAERLEVNKELAKEIAEEINSKIFFPIRENLRKIHKAEAAPEGGEPRPESSGRETAPPIGKPIPEVPKEILTKAEVEPPPPPAPPTEEKPTIFEAKTKEEVFRQPLTNIDPYREPTI